MWSSIFGFLNVTNHYFQKLCIHYEVIIWYKREFRQGREKDLLVDMSDGCSLALEKDRDKWLKGKREEERIHMLIAK